LGDADSAALLAELNEERQTAAPTPSITPQMRSALLTTFERMVTLDKARQSTMLRNLCHVAANVDLSDFF
jgi:hypothetical protein